MTTKKKKPASEQFDALLRSLLERIRTAPVADALDLALYASCAYLGYRMWDTWEGAVYGMVSLRLACVPYSQVSNTAGLLGLVSIGLADISGLPDIQLPGVKPGGEKIGEVIRAGFDWSRLVFVCPEGYSGPMWFADPVHPPGMYCVFQTGEHRGR